MKRFTMLAIACVSMSTIVAGAAIAEPQFDASAAPHASGSLNSLSGISSYVKPTTRDGNVINGDFRLAAAKDCSERPDVSPTDYHTCVNQTAAQLQEAASTGSSVPKGF